MAESSLLGDKPSQFPSKFGALPQISARNSPEVNAQNQLVPLNKTSIDGLEAEEKIRHLETRINVTEKSNRALLEEVVRLQSELKGNVRRSDELLREERNFRSQLENALRANNDVIQQLTNRLARAEEKSQEERNAISTLVNHTKNVEQTVLGSQQELIGRRDIQNQKMADLKREIDEVTRAKDALERLSYQLIDEVRQTKSKVESQQVELQQNAQDFKNKSKKLEEENRQMRLDNMRKQNESTNHTEHNSTQLRQQVETRLGELRDILVELRNKQDTETQERRLLEQQLQLKVNDLHNGLAEQTRRREEAMHALDVVQREREHAAENERIKLQSRIAEIAEEVSKKILHKEIKLREEATDKFTKIEKFVSEEHEARINYESHVRDDVEERWSELQKSQQDSLRNVKDMQKMDRQKYAETIQKLDEAMNILEEQVDEQRKQNDKLMAAEIKSRKQHEAFTLEKVEDLQEKLSLGITTLQQAIGGVTTQFEKEIKQLKREAIKAGQMGADNGDKIDELVEDQAKRIQKLKKELEATISSNDEKIQALLAWQNSVKKTIKDFNKVKELPDDMYSLEEKTKEKLEDFKTRLASESEARNKDIENIKKDMARLPRGGGGGGPPAPVQLGPSREDMEACQASVKTLAESVQTVKTVLGMKIQSEQKSRNADIDKLRNDLEDIRLQLESMSRTKPVPRLFVKEKTNMDRDKAEKNQAAINKWSLYNAYRWLKFKEKLMGVARDGATSPTETATETEATTEPTKETEDTEDTDDDDDTTTEATTTAPGQKSSNDDDDDDDATTEATTSRDDDDDATTTASGKPKDSIPEESEEDTETETETETGDDDDEETESEATKPAKGGRK